MTLPVDRLPSVAIAGDGLTGWMAATALAKAFGSRAGRITVLGLPQRDPLPAFGSSTPAMRLFHEKSAIPEDEFLRATAATFKIATELTGWREPGKSFLHPYGQYGTNIGTLGFHHCWFRLHERAEAADLVNYSLAGLAASLGRFAHPVAETESIFSSFSYGFHFDPVSYREYLKKCALTRGVELEHRKVVDVALRGGDGFIDALLLDDGDRAAADIYLDCTDGEAFLAGTSLQVGYEDWSRWLPCDRMLHWRSAPDADPFPATQIAAGEAGWRWRIPLQDGTSEGAVFCSAFTDAERAKDAGGSGEPVLQSFVNGRRKKFWHKNCIALGGAAGFLEPLEATGIHLAASGIARLLQLLPGPSVSQADADEYNRLLTADFELARDFLILHYHANSRTGSAFWDRCRAADIPASLADRIELFRSRGRIAPRAGEAFLLTNWLSVFSGMGIFPRRYHPFADGLEIDEIRNRMGLIQSAVRRAAEAMPMHRAYLAHALGQSK